MGWRLAESSDAGAAARLSSCRRRSAVPGRSSPIRTSG